MLPSGPAHANQLALRSADDSQTRTPATFTASESLTSPRLSPKSMGLCDTLGWSQIAMCQSRVNILSLLLLVAVESKLCL